MSGTVWGDALFVGTGISTGRRAAGHHIRLHFLRKNVRHRFAHHDRHLAARHAKSLRRLSSGQSVQRLFRHGHSRVQPSRQSRRKSGLFHRRRSLLRQYRVLALLGHRRLLQLASGLSGRSEMERHRLQFHSGLGHHHRRFDLVRKALRLQDMAADLRSEPLRGSEAGPLFELSLGRMSLRIEPIRQLSHSDHRISEPKFRLEHGSRVDHTFGRIRESVRGTTTGRDLLPDRQQESFPAYTRFLPDLPGSSEATAVMGVGPGIGGLATDIANVYFTVFNEGDWSWILNAAEDGIAPGLRRLGRFDHFGRTSQLEGTSRSQSFVFEALRMRSGSVLGRLPGQRVRPSYGNQRHFADNVRRHSSARLDPVILKIAPVPDVRA